MYLYTNVYKYKCIQIQIECSWIQIHSWAMRGVFTIVEMLNGFQSWCRFPHSFSSTSLPSREATPSIPHRWLEKSFALFPLFLVPLPYSFLPFQYPLSCLLSILLYLLSFVLPLLCLSYFIFVYLSSLSIFFFKSRFSMTDYSFLRILPTPIIPLFLLITLIN